MTVTSSIFCSIKHVFIPISLGSENSSKRTQRMAFSAALVAIVNTQDKRNMIDNDIDLPFNMSELKKAVLNVKKTSPGKDNICYTMLAHMEDSMLDVILKLFNTIWKTGKIPTVWKQSVIVPILKPGKDLYNPSSYRPIALTSQLGKQWKGW